MQSLNIDNHLLSNITYYLILMILFSTFVFYFLNSSTKGVSAESRLHKLHGEIKSSLKIDNLVSTDYS